MICKGIKLTEKRLNDSDGKRSKREGNAIESGWKMELRREIKCMVLWSS